MMMMISESRSMMGGVCIFLLMLVVIFVVCSVGLYSGNLVHLGNEDGNNKTVAVGPGDPYLSTRKLFLHGACSRRDISISQSSYPSPGGIPQFIVQIVNTCVSQSDCAPSNIHLRCGWFASARTVNPRTFKRLSYDDCLLNAGKPLKTSHAIRFTYANSFMYPLQFKSADFC